MFPRPETMRLRDLRITLCALLLCLLCGHESSEAAPRVLRLTGDSLHRSAYPLNAGWLFSPGDDSARALPGFDDSGWTEVNPELLHPADSVFATGIGWFRLHLESDSSLDDRTLALAISHYGASEIYIDGRLLHSFGRISGRDSSVYTDPQALPFIFRMPGAGSHVLAVRYANYDAKKNFRWFKSRFTGFRMYVGDPDLAILSSFSNGTVFTGIYLFLSGLFLALSLIHFLLYMYYRAARSNLYFCLLTLSLAACCIIGQVNSTSDSPLLQMTTSFLYNPLLIMASLSFSGFINELFGKKKLRLKIFTVIGLFSFIVYLFSQFVAAILVLGLVIAVSFEALFTILFGILRKVPGSRIIGTGILFFVLFFLTTFTVAIMSGGSVNIDDSTLGGKIFIVLLILAVMSIPVSMSAYLAWKFSSVNSDLSLRLEEVNVLSRKNLEQEKEKQRLLENKKTELEYEVQQRTADLNEAMQKSEELLLNILPAEVATELKEKGRASAKTYSLVTVMFMDFKDFTRVSELISAELLVAEIDACFSAFDHIVQRHRIEKIKTIGDAYICAAGLPVSNYTHATDSIQAAQEIIRFMEERRKAKEVLGEIPFEIRIGIHTGPVVAGIVGIKKFAYDIWGDTVNLAARMEQNSEAGRINISGSTYALVKDKYRCAYRGKIEAKNKGELDMYYVEGPVS
jgi:adenylate cyclase